MRKLNVGDDNAISRALAEKDLEYFIRVLWRSIDPSPFVGGWHISAICEHLEAVTRGEIKRLIITMPPRHMKSIAVSVAWPAWSWLYAPEKRFLCSSYAHALAIRDSLKCRRLIDSPQYQAWWGDKFQLTTDQNTKVRFDNDKQGYRLSTSVGGMITGEGGDIILIDDPHNVRDMESETKRASAISWWDESMSTRLNDAKTGAYVIVAQRTHYQDMIGHALEQEEWVHLNLPAEYEPSNKCTTICGWEDPRTIEGELLWPEKFDDEALAVLKEKLGTYGAAAQLQQRPSPKGGGLIEIAWFKYVTEIPHYTLKIQSWDTAFKENQQNDYSVCTTWVMTYTGYILTHVWRGKLAFPELKRMALALYTQEKPDVVLIEDKASGQSLIQEFRKTTLPILAVSVDRDKISRVNAISPAIEAGKVSLIADASWLAVFLAECMQFPAGEHDDQIDSMTQAIEYLKKTISVQSPIIMGISQAAQGAW